MKGFLTQDLYLSRWNWLFLTGFMILFLLVSSSVQSMFQLWGIYGVIFSGSILMGCFYCDEENGWNGFAAAVPGGRKRMVDARYLMAALTAVWVCVFMVMGSVLIETRLTLGLFYGGLTLAYLAVLFPICYRFGSAKTRIVLAGGITALCCAGGMILDMMEVRLWERQGLLWQDLGMVLLGVVLCLLSRKLSLHIVAKKEF